MIFCNGCSKSGTHILTNLCKVAGLKQLGGTVIKRKPSREFEMVGENKLQRVFRLPNGRFVHSHIAYALSAELALVKHKHLFILRNPRDIAVSWMRHRAKQDPSLKEGYPLLKKLIQQGMYGESVPDFFLGFVEWLDKQNIYVVKFEDVKSTSFDFTPMFEYLGIEAPEESIKSALGVGPTFNKRTSDWRDVWTDELQDIWKDSNGEKAEAAVSDFYSASDFEFESPSVDSLASPIS